MPQNQLKVFEQKLSIAQQSSNAELIGKIASILGEDGVSQMMDEANQLRQLMTYYRCAILEVETKFKVLNEEFSLEHERNPIESIKTRLKSPESIIEKLMRKGYDFSATAIEKNLYDVAGIRVICSFLDDIYLLADCLLAQDDIRLIERKDYIQNPKENGYRSLHLIVEIPIFLQEEKRLMKVEVQLRTIAMDFWANLEHKLRYKKNLPQWLNLQTSEELSECAKLSAVLDNKMQNIRNIIESEYAEEEEQPSQMIHEMMEA